MFFLPLNTLWAHRDLIHPVSQTRKLLPQGMIFWWSMCWMCDLCGFTLEKLLESFRQTKPWASRICVCFVAFVPWTSCRACSYQQQVKCFLWRVCEGLWNGLWDPLGKMRCRQSVTAWGLWFAMRSELDICLYLSCKEVIVKWLLSCAVKWLLLQEPLDRRDFAEMKDEKVHVHDGLPPKLWN